MMMISYLKEKEKAVFFNMLYLFILLRKNKRTQNITLNSTIELWYAQCTYTKRNFNVEKRRIYWHIMK